MTDFRADLAQPEPQGLPPMTAEEHGRFCAEIIKKAQIDLAQPEPQGPTDEELYDYWISTSPEFGCADPVGFARAVLTRWGRPAIKPVPVADERPWEREGWCNADGKCWAGYPELEYPLGETGDFDVCDPEWQLVDPRSLINTRLPIVLLPHHALPVPQQEVDCG